MGVIGFVDNNFELFPDYKKRLGRHGIALLFPDVGKSKEEIVDWILQNDVRCLIVDSYLRPSFDYAGRDLVAYINSALPDVPCIMLSEDKQELDASDIIDFYEKLYQAVDLVKK